MDKSFISNSDKSDKNSGAPLAYPSLASLRAAHSALLKRHREEGNTPEIITTAQNFIRHGRATGAVLDVDDDRWAAQGLLDYWSTMLYRAEVEPPDAALVEFDPTLAPELDDSLCPYVGLNAFREMNHEIFFGRQRLIEKLVEHLRDNRLLAVVGPSGSGKSSVVLAGLLPALKAGGVEGSANWRYYSPLVPGSNPLENLARTLRPSVGTSRTWVEEHTQKLREDTKYLAQLLDEQNETPAVLVIDQFEEVFTLCRDEEMRRAFVRSLVELTQAAEARHTVILTMRTDFESNVALLPQFQPLFERALVRVPPLNAGELRDAIVRPAELVGLKFEEGIVDALIQDILGEPAALPLLQFTLWKLWEHRERNRITWHAYRRLGSGRVALARSANELYNDLIPEEQVTAKRIILRMVRPSEGLEVTSNRVRVSSLYQTGEAHDRVHRVLNRLIRARLIRLTEGETPADAQVEVAHEALVRNWPRLVGWLDDERVRMRQRLRLTAAAQQWEASGRDSSALLRGVMLDEALRYEDLNELEQLFVDASIARKEEEKRREQERTRRIIMSLATGLIVVALLATVAVWQWFQTNLAREDAVDAQNDAIAQVHARNTEIMARITAEAEARTNEQVAATRAAEAEQQARIALANRLATEAQAVFVKYPQRSLLLAIEALNVTTDAGEPRVSAAEEVLRDALANYGGMGLRGHEESITAIAISPNRQWAATGSVDQTVWLWELEDPAAPPLVLYGHTGAIVAVTFTPDNRWLITGSGDATARLWDMSDIFAPPIILSGHKGAITALALSPDGRWLATGSADRTTRLWDLTDYDPATAVRVLSGHEGSVTALAFSSDSHWLASGGNDAAVLLWDLTDTYAAPITLRAHRSRVTAIAFSFDERWLATGGDDATAIMWDLDAGDSGDAFVTLRGHRGAITSLAFNPNNDWLVTGSVDKTARRWDLSSPHPEVAPLVLSGHEAAINTLAISRDGRWLITGSRDWTARLWNLDLPDPAAAPIILPGHEDGVTALAVGPDSFLLLTGSGRGAARLWELGQPIVSPLVLPFHQAEIWTVAISPDNHWLVTGSANGTARVWDLTAPDPVGASFVLRGHEGGIRTIAISPDGRWLVTGSVDSTARLWDLAAEDPAAEPLVLRGHTNDIVTAAFSPDGRWLATASHDNTARLWDLAELADAAIVLRGHAELITSLAFSPDGRWLATASIDGTTRLWNVADLSAAPLILGGTYSSVNAVAFSPDGQWLATGNGDGAAQLWSLETIEDEMPSVLLEHEGAIWTVAFSPDGRWLVTGSEDRTARVWDMREQQAAPVVLRGHEGGVNSVAISPDGRLLATGSGDGTARLWNLADLDTPPVVLRGHEGAILTLAMSADGHWLVTGSADRTARLWTLRLRELINLACETAGCNLTEAEWKQYLAGEPYRATCSDLYKPVPIKIPTPVAPRPPLPTRTPSATPTSTNTPTREPTGTATATPTVTNTSILPETDTPTAIPETQTVTRVTASPKPITPTATLEWYTATPAATPTGTPTERHTGTPTIPPLPTTETPVVEPYPIETPSLAIIEPPTSIPTIDSGSLPPAPKVVIEVRTDTGPAPAKWTWWYGIEPNGCVDTQPVQCSEGAVCLEEDGFYVLSIDSGAVESIIGDGEKVSLERLRHGAQLGLWVHGGRDGRLTVLLPDYAIENNNPCTWQGENRAWTEWDNANFAYEILIIKVRQEAMAAAQPGTSIQQQPLDYEIPCPCCPCADPPPCECVCPPCK